MVMRVQKLTSVKAPAVDQSFLLGLVEAKMSSLVQSGHCGPSSPIEGAAKAAHFHLASGGSRVRARLALHASCTLELLVKDSVVLAATAELLHNASLVHDDLHDRDRTRRGAKTVWLAFGDNVAICTGDLLISLAYGCLATFGDVKALPELLSTMNARVCEAIHGQCADLKAQSLVVADIALYERIVIAKSGALLSLPFELAFIGSGHRESIAEARRAVESFAIGYQIVDDIDDVDRDAGSVDAPNSLNLVHVMKALGHGDASTKMARELGKKHFAKSISAAALLPKGSGAFLMDLASKLVLRL
jgi:geranylgeranyl pyrophosphate synthase